MRLRGHDYRLLLEAVEDLHGACDPEAFTGRAMASIQVIISSDIISFNEVNIPRQRIRAGFEPKDVADDFRDWPEVFARHMHEHPLIRHIHRTGCMEAIRISDFLTQRQFYKLGLYREFYSRLRIRYQMAIAVIHSPTVMLAFALNREEKGFSERERLLLNQLRPHLANAYETADEWARLKGHPPPGSLEFTRQTMHSLGLSKREAEVLIWIAAGKTNRDTGVILGISERTVQKHLEHIYRKLGLENRFAAISWASKES